jgi:hypothetical protein
MFLRRDGKTLFPLGLYDRPKDRSEWQACRDAGVNLVRCASREDLDEVAEYGMLGWVNVPMVLADDDDGAALGERIDSLKNHPALAIWEAPDEVIWNAWWDTKIPRRIWQESPETIAEKKQKMDGVVRGLARGTAIVREHDPSRKLWLNEAALSPLDIVARCAAYIDVIGFDIYPIGVFEDNFAQPSQIMGLDIDRFRAAAPGKEFWMVEQAFSYPDLGEGFGYLPGGFPTLNQTRFHAWQAVLHGTTGLLWYGLGTAKRPAPFFDDLMKVISEVNSVMEFMDAGPIPGVTGAAHHSWRPSIMGCSCVAKRSEGKTFVMMINEDAHAVDMFVSGLDSIDYSSLVPIYEPSSDLTPLDGGLITPMEGHETRIYVAE